MLANTDTVTGLPNRNAIHQQISLALERSERDETGVVYLDLDNFKKVNDAYGHMFGDQLLQAVSLAILSCLGKDQTLAGWVAMSLWCWLSTPARLRWRRCPPAFLSACVSLSVSD